MQVDLFSLNFASILFRDFQGFLDFASIKFRDFSQSRKSQKSQSLILAKLSENKVFQNKEMIVAVNAIYAVA